MLVFGGYEAYQLAPRRMAQEQALVWLAKTRDEQERKQQEIEATRA